MDTLEITGIQVSTRIGVHAFEQHILQTLHIDVVAELPLANLDDTLANTLDYSAVCDEIIATVGTGSFQLIETVAETVLSIVKRMAKEARVKVCVSKPHALPKARNVRVCLHSG